jgi:SAM-dependent methyltransferase
MHTFNGGGGSGDRAQNIQTNAAAHYNARGDTHRTLNSKIDTLQQKNLNNWVKAMLITSAVRPKYSILDLACGKGGDLPKWSKQEIGHYVGVDIAYGSICDAIQRYNGNERNRQGCQFPAVWAAGNFVNPNFFDKLDKVEPGIRFDAVSCQVPISSSRISVAHCTYSLRGWLNLKCCSSSRYTTHGPQRKMLKMLSETPPSVSSRSMPCIFSATLPSLQALL